MRESLHVQTISVEPHKKTSDVKKKCFSCKEACYC